MSSKSDLHGESNNTSSRTGGFFRTIRKWVVIIVGLIVLVPVVVLTLGKMSGDFSSGTSVVVDKTGTIGSGKTEEEFRYEIIKEAVDRDRSRELRVRLNKKLSEETLRALATKLKDSDRRKFRTTRIFYYLEGTRLWHFSDPWAASHFDPDLTVKISGVSLEKEASLLNETRTVPGESVGWWMNNGSTGGIVTIYRVGGKTFVKNLYRDGSRSKKEVIEKRTSQGTRYDYKVKSATGDYFLISAAGDLDYGDKDGLFDSARKIDRFRRTEIPEPARADSEAKQARLDKSPPAIQLQLDVSVRTDGSLTYFFGKTNLPEGTKLGIKLTGPGKYLAQDWDIIVGNGRFESSGFGNKGNPLRGVFRLELLTRFNKHWQSEKILKELSSYKSPMIKDSELELRKTISLGVTQ